MKREKAVQRGITHHIVASNEQGQIRSNERNRRKQIHDHLRTPVRHLAPGQQITHKGFSHQAQKDGTAENPQQLTRLAVGAVNQTTEHVQIHHHEKSRGAG